MTIIPVFKLIFTNGVKRVHSGIKILEHIRKPNPQIVLLHVKKNAKHKNVNNKTEIIFIEISI